jgi:cystathionine gamma-synthase
MSKPTKKGTASVWAGEGNVNTQGTISTPIVNSVTFAYHDLEEWHQVSLGNKKRFYL